MYSRTYVLATMAFSAPFVYDPVYHHHLLRQIVQIHADCIINDGTLATFLPDPETKQLDLQKLIRHWEDVDGEVKAGKRVIIVQLFHPAQRGKDVEEEVAGVVILYMPETETGAFRSEVHKLLVSRKHRKKGIAKQLMKKLEDTAFKHGRSLIMLDTTLGSGAEFVYPKLGYIESGRIPKYGIHPLTGKLEDEVFFYKDLREY
nr:acetyltransferase [Quercus suber]